MNTEVFERLSEASCSITDEEMERVTGGSANYGIPVYTTYCNCGGFNSGSYSNGLDITGTYSGSILPFQFLGLSISSTQSAFLNNNQTPEQVAAAEGVSIKPGADISNITEQMKDAIDEIADAWASETNGVTPVITSGTDGVHSANSLHYSGNALDLRANNISSQDAANIVNYLQIVLGGDYDIIYETYNNPANNHIHIEYDPGP